MKNLRITAVPVLIIASMFAVGFATQNACATLKPVVDQLPRVSVYVQDAQLVLAGIETFERAVFAAKPDPDLQKKVDQGMADAHAALDAALRICAGATELSQAQVDAAFADFKAAYLRVIAVLGPLGVHRAPIGARVGAGSGGYAAPDPLVFGR